MQVGFLSSLLTAALCIDAPHVCFLQSTRDRLWQQQRQLKEGSVFVTNPMLVQDMQVWSAVVVLGSMARRQRAAVVDSTCIHAMQTQHQADPLLLSLDANGWTGLLS